MPIIEAGAELSFVRRQVVTARNVAGGRFTHFALGGLNYQIEHHLFPTMPRANLARAQSLVRAFCIESGLGYCETTLLGSYHQAVRSLRAAAATAAPVPVVALGG
jgi:fatty acid desaturase